MIIAWHPEQAFFRLVGVSNESLCEVCRGAGHVRKALGDEATRAALRECQSGAPIPVQASYRAFEGLLTLAEVLFAKAGDDLLFDRVNLLLCLLISGGPGR